VGYPTLQMTFYKGRTIFPSVSLYERWNFNSGNYLFTTDTK